MKRLLLLLTLAFFTLACENPEDYIDDRGHGLVFLSEQMKAIFSYKGDSKNYQFTSDYDWTAEVSADWVEVTPTSGTAGDNMIHIKVDKNKSDKRRTGYVDITLSNGASGRIELEQLADGEEYYGDSSIPNNEIWYTTSNDMVYDPVGANGEPIDDYVMFGAHIVSNTYKDGKGVITFDGDVTKVGSSAFLSSPITGVKLPNSVTVIETYAFAWTNLREISIPSSVTMIEKSAMFSCTFLEEVHIPNSVVTIGDGAFYGCFSLKDITIPDSVTTIGRGVFGACFDLKEFKGKFAADNGRCLVNDGAIIAYANASGSEYTIPDYVTSVGEDAFNGSRISSVAIPSSVITIDGYAFSCCSQLSNVQIGSNVETIGGSAFGDCTSMQTITIPNSVEFIGIGTFGGCSNLKEFKGKYVADNGRCLIQDDTIIAYAEGSGVEYVIPDSVTKIGDGAFWNCRNLTSVSIPEGVSIIGYAAFYGCFNLQHVNIPEGVYSIDAAAFESCRSLTEITLPRSIEEISWHAFGHCETLSSVYCKAVSIPLALPSYDVWEAFVGNAADRKIYVPMMSVEEYKTREFWSDYADAIVGYDFTE